MQTRQNPYQREYRAFTELIEGKPIKVGDIVVLGLKSLFGILEMVIRYVPGGLGYKLRYYFYKPLLKQMGTQVLIDTGVFLNGCKNISLGDYVWVDANCRIEAMLGEVSIGKRVHVAPFSILAAREPIIIEDYVGISSCVKIYSNSEHPIDGKRMSGPMIPERYKAFHSKPIILRKDSFVGTNSVLLPGAYLEEGAVVGANCVLSKPVSAWTIVAGSPPRPIKMRSPVTVPDL